MKKMTHYVVKLFLFAIALPALGGYIYDAEKKTITDANWTFEVTKVSGIELTVKADSESFIGTDPVAIDFSEVKGTDGKSYDVVEFNNGENKKDRVTAFIAPKCWYISGGFSGCENLTRVLLDASKTVKFGNYCFQNCKNLEIFEPRKIELVGGGYYVFQNCSKLTGEFIVCNTKTIQRAAFNSTQVEKVSGENVTSVEQEAFSNCLNLREVSFPNATSIGQGAFSKCARLERVDCPNVSVILHSAFSGCTSIDESDVKILLNAGITKLGFIGSGKFWGSIFAGCTGIKGKIIWDFPNLSTNAVPPSMFENCSSITAVEFKTPVCDIGGNAFLGISPGAEIYLGRSQIKVFGREAIGTATIPYPKIFVRNFDEGLISAMEKTNITLREKDFRNTSWVSPLGSAYTHGWTAGFMYKDNTVCEKITIDKVSYPSPIINRVHAFVAWNHCCWVIGEPKGFSVKIR